MLRLTSSWQSTFFEEYLMRMMTFEVRRRPSAAPTLRTACRAPRLT
jgi:hypothetical protein